MPHGLLYRWSRRGQIAVWITLLALGTLDCGGAPRRSTPIAAERGDPLRPCSIASVAGAAMCGVVRVPENWEEPNGRQLDLNTVILPSTADRRRVDPIVVLAGGPGQGSATLAAHLSNELAALRSDRDVVLIDQRGTGRSNPLICTGGLGLLGKGRAAIEQCLTVLSRRADVSRYTSHDAVRDLEAARVMLGYTRLNLVGVSYGTRVAQLYAAAYPSHVRTLVLRAAAPPDFNIVRDGERNARRALRRLVTECAQSETCSRAYPALGAELDSLLERSARTQVQTHGPTTESSGEDTVPIDRTLLGQTLYALLLTAPTRQQLPFLVHRAATEGLQTLEPIASRVRAALFSSIPVGMYLSVVCTEDVPLLTPAERAELSSTETLVSRDIVAACDAWPVTPTQRDPRPRTPLTLPVLLISGVLDPATEVSSVSALAATWPAARHIVLPHTAHGPTLPGCTAALVVAFMEEAGGKQVDDSCVRDLPPTPFLIPRETSQRRSE